jgi:hypothetical protein
MGSLDPIPFCQLALVWLTESTIWGAKESFMGGLLSPTGFEPCAKPRGFQPPGFSEMLRLSCPRWGHPDTHATSNMVSSTPLNALEQYWPSVSAIYDGTFFFWE